MSDMGLGPLLRLAGPREPLPDEIEERTRAHARAAWQAALHRRIRRRRVRALAAGLAVVGAVTAYRFARMSVVPVREVARVEVTSGRGPLPVGTVLAAGDFVSTAGERLALRLSSGVGLRVDRETRLRLVSESAIELVEGGLYAVSSAEGRGLDVHTPRGIVRDIGTRFEVRCLAGAVRVRVREGRVSLATKAGRADAAAGEELVTTEKAPTARRAIATSGAEWDWTAEVAPPFQVEGRTLGAFLAWFSAETGRAVRFADPALSRQAERMVLRGSVNDLTPEEALEAVLPAVGLAARRTGETVELSRAGR